MSKQKKEWVTHITSKDEKMLKAFSDVGHLNKSMLREDLDIAENRIRNFEKDGYIQQKDFLNKRTKNMDRVYSLTEKGRRLCREELDTKYFYKSNSSNHDLALANRYLQEPEENRNCWVTENQLRDEFKTYLEDLKLADYDRWEELSEKYSNGEISCPDGAIRVSGEVTTAIEVVTACYDKADKAAKIEYAKELNVNLEVERG